MKILSNKKFEQLKSLEKTNQFLSNHFRASLLCLEILSKYKEIIGGDK